MDLKRKKAKMPSAEYPQAKEVKQDRRRFLGLLGKGLLGITALTTYRCMGAAPDPGEQELSGPLDLTSPDDVQETDWTLQGGAPLPEEVRDEDALSCSLDTEGEFPPLAGEPREPEDVRDGHLEEDVPPLAGDMPAPDVIAEDLAEEDLPPLAGDMPAPDVTTSDDVDAGPDSGDFPPIDGDMEIPQE